MQKLLLKSFLIKSQTFDWRNQGQSKVIWTYLLFCVYTGGPKNKFLKTFSGPKYHISSISKLQMKLFNARIIFLLEFQTIKLGLHNNFFIYIFSSTEVLQFFLRRLSLIFLLRMPIHYSIKLTSYCYHYQFLLVPKWSY